MLDMTTGRDIQRDGTHSWRRRDCHPGELHFPVLGSNGRQRRALMRNGRCQVEGGTWGRLRLPLFLIRFERQCPHPAMDRYVPSRPGIGDVMTALRHQAFRLVQVISLDHAHCEDARTEVDGPFLPE
jgi:hypothetical protein